MMAWHVLVGYSEFDTGHMHANNLPTRSVSSQVVYVGWLETNIDKLEYDVLS